jgi:hypothetical protein
MACTPNAHVVEAGQTRNESAEAAMRSAKETKQAIFTPSKLAI